MTRKTLLRMLLAIRFMSEGRSSLARVVLPKKFKRPIFSQIDEWFVNSAMKVLSNIIGLGFSRNAINLESTKIGDTILVRKPPRWIARG